MGYKPNSLGVRNFRRAQSLWLEKMCIFLGFFNEFSLKSIFNYKMWWGGMGWPIKLAHYGFRENTYFNKIYLAIILYLKNFEMAENGNWNSLCLKQRDYLVAI